MSKIEATVTVGLSSPIVIVKPRTFAVYDGKRILNTRQGTVDSTCLWEGFKGIVGIVDVKIGHDARSLTLTVLTGSIPVPTSNPHFMVAVTRLLREIANNDNNQLFPEHEKEADLTVTFTR